MTLTMLHWGSETGQTRIVRSVETAVEATSMKRILLLWIVVTVGFVGVLNLREASSAIVLGATTSLLIAERLTSPRRKEACARY